MENEKYYLKAMNCPHHHKIYSATPKSYRDLPVRFGEHGHCYRYEDSGSLFGLMRVRSLCQNDAHIYCTEEQFEEEFGKVLDLYQYYFDLFGIDKYQMRLSKHSKEGLGKKYVDNEELWIKTEDQIREVMIKMDVPFIEVEDEAAFYGPKIDVQIWSVIGREFTLATNQLDFAVPARFDLKYTDQNGEEKTPICIHRAPLSTHERMVGFLIEHYAGAFPVWLAPVQFKVIPVADVFNEYAESVSAMLRKAGARVEIDISSDSLSKKVRNSQTSKIPVSLIIGEQEENDKTVTLRKYGSRDQETMSLEDLMAWFNTENQY
jgi:threonyl-tRNA synthetase